MIAPRTLYAEIGAELLILLGLLLFVGWVAVNAAAWLFAMVVLRPAEAIAAALAGDVTGRRG